MSQSTSLNAPSTLRELLEYVARETARMSYPGSMSRGNKPIVEKGTKAALEEYFATKFPLNDLWISAPHVAGVFENWHHSSTAEIAKAIESRVPERNEVMAVAAKFLNTFMHQLMKYEPCRALWPALHLPLDARVFAKLARLTSPSLSGVKSSFLKSPYSLPYVEYLDIQRALWNFVQELNSRPRADFRFRSRIELNWLWI